MRWERKTRDREDWHHWFAWHPVAIGGQCVWLETVERKGEYRDYGVDPLDTIGASLTGEWIWEYR